MISTRRAIGASLLAALLLLPGATGCAATSGNTAAGAVAALGTGVALAGANRAITGDCWGRCSAGYVCNRASGLCESGECRPACDPGTYCTITSLGHTCAASSVAYLGPQQPTAVPVRPNGDYRIQQRDAELRQPDPSRTDSAPGRSELGQVQIEKGNPGPVGDPATPPPAPGQNASPQTPGPGPTPGPMVAPPSASSTKAPTAPAEPPATGDKDAVSGQGKAPESVDSPRKPAAAEEIAPQAPKQESPQ